MLQTTCTVGQCDCLLILNNCFLLACFLVQIGAEEFLDDSLLSEVSLLYAPSQIALASLVYSAQEQGFDLNGYITDVLLATEDDVHKAKILETLKHIISLAIKVRQFMLLL